MIRTKSLQYVRPIQIALQKNRLLTNDNTPDILIDYNGFG